MLQNVVQFSNYAVAVLVQKINTLFCSNYAKNYASTIRQGQVSGRLSPKKPGLDSVKGRYKR